MRGLKRRRLRRRGNSNVVEINPQTSDHFSRLSRYVCA